MRISSLFYKFILLLEKSEEKQVWKRERMAIVPKLEVPTTTHTHAKP